MKKVCVVGLECGGLPTALVTSLSGLKVNLVDENFKDIDSAFSNYCCKENIESEELLNKCIDLKNLSFSSNIKESDFFILTGSIDLLENKNPNIEKIIKAITEIAKFLKLGDLIIVESTIPIGAFKYIHSTLSNLISLKIGSEIFLVYCPKRVSYRPSINEIMVCDRMIGALDDESCKLASTFYQSFISGDIFITNIDEIELVALIEHSFQDVLFAFSNQVALLSKEIGVDPYNVIDLANKWTSVPLSAPSSGVGGRCLPIDPWFLISSFPKITSLLKFVRIINDSRPQEIIQNIKLSLDEFYKNNHKKCNILFLGASCRFDENDFYLSPSLEIIRNILLKNSNVSSIVVDPFLSKEYMSEFLFKNKIEDKDIEDADIIICLVAHSKFKKIDFEKIKNKQILDFCGIFHVAKTPSIEQGQFCLKNRNQDNDENSNESLSYS